MAETSTDEQSVEGDLAAAARLDPLELRTSAALERLNQLAGLPVADAAAEQYRRALLGDAIAETRDTFFALAKDRRRWRWRAKSTDGSGED